MEDISTLVDRMRSSDRVRVLPAAGALKLSTSTDVPTDLQRFFSLCGGVDFLDTESGHVEYRIFGPQNVVNIGVAICGEENAEAPLDMWFAIGENDNGEPAAIDLAPSRSGQCYDVFHETFWDPESARIVAGTFTEFVERLFAQGRAYWFDEGFVSRYFTN